MRAGPPAWAASGQAGACLTPPRAPPGLRALACRAPSSLTPTLQPPLTFKQVGDWQVLAAGVRSRPHHRGARERGQACGGVGGGGRGGGAAERHSAQPITAPTPAPSSSLPPTARQHLTNPIPAPRARSSKIGYRLALVKLADGATTNPRAVEHREFLTGFLGGRRGAPKAQQPSWGRPADVQQLPDGSLLISDDGAHTVYRMHWVGGGGGGK